MTEIIEIDGYKFKPTNEPPKFGNVEFLKHIDLLYMNGIDGFAIYAGTVRNSGDKTKIEYHINGSIGLIATYYKDTNITKLCHSRRLVYWSYQKPFEPSNTPCKSLHLDLYDPDEVQPPNNTDVTVIGISYAPARKDKPLWIDNDAFYMDGEFTNGDGEKISSKFLWGYRLNDNDLNTKEDISYEQKNNEDNKMKVSVINAKDVCGEGTGVGIIKTYWGGWRIMLWWYHVVIRADNKDVEKDQ